MNRQKKHTQAFILVALLFLLFGSLTVLIQLLLPHLRDVFQLHYSDAAYILLSFFLSYLFFSIPAGFILTKIGYQRGIILGLLLISLGALLFYPAAGERLYWVFLTAIFILGCGVTFLQVAMNSYIVILGDEATTPRRLTFSQAFNAIGTTIAPILGSYAVNYFIDMNITKDILESPFMCFIVETLGLLAGKPHLTSTDPKAIIAVFLTFYWGGAMLGRFISVYLIKWIAPAKVLIAFAIVAISLILFSINTGSLLSMWTLLSIGLFNSMMFPTIFALACEGIDKLKTQASGILCTMIVGGGLLPILYGSLTDYIGFRLAFLTLVVCYGYIAFFGFYKNNK
ncbi:glucose/galactose transporter [Capnocytophaga ochracea F0287]|uniref:Glucose/galactose transporter n=1 Tax=Capnocytophaga ochracea F0287 TaxID=873517 RepID=E4MNT3_CAPOC|nr:MFS transporter [Capnocytophaga ochracea]EFS98690.1 glucose/galactose transporter [Capnocytophaga ochracea F0287]EJF43980.1 putative glucose/galactose transporter [Capnocytophaga ochracea str. Holt 25]